jgi:dolichol-phosphate mannosyltransferase
MAINGMRGGHRTKDNAIVSVVTPALNEEHNLRELYRRVSAALTADGWTFELIIVNDGSADGTVTVVRELRSEDPRVHHLSLSRSFGHQAALLAGMGHSRGDVVISMDSDLQHPPELLLRMLRCWQDGYDVVHTIKRTDISAGFFRRVISRAFYGLFTKLSGLPIGFGQSDFRLLDAHVARQLCRLPEYHKFLRGLVIWMGFNQTAIEYDVAPRLSGRPTYTLTRRLRFHLDAILSFSVIPLRLFTICGLLVCLPAGLYGLLALVGGLYGFIFGYPRWVVRGWASLAIFITFLGGVQLIGIGIVGEYLARVFEQTKGRPPFLISDTSLRAGEETHRVHEMVAMRGGQDTLPTVPHADA